MRHAGFTPRRRRDAAVAQPQPLWQCADPAAPETAPMEPPPMPSAPVWSARHLVCRAHGCELSVMWRLDGRWSWVVTVAGERIADGQARSQEGAQDAAVEAARRHSDDGGRIQLPLL